MKKVVRMERQYNRLWRCDYFSAEFEDGTVVNYVQRGRGAELLGSVQGREEYVHAAWAALQKEYGEVFA